MLDGYLAIIYSITIERSNNFNKILWKKSEELNGANCQN